MRSTRDGPISGTNTRRALSATAVRSQELTTTVAAASEEASANVQSVASATEDLSSSVNEISRQVQESARMAPDAVGQARTTNDPVGELSKAASRIGDVVELINAIAGQTNLLALNATIEAARARLPQRPARRSIQPACARARQLGRIAPVLLRSEIDVRSQGAAKTAV